MKRLILILTLLFSLLKAQTLDVLSWNIYLLPGITNLSKEIQKSDKKTRAIEIANYINQSGYEIIVFQEAFFPPARKKLSKLIEEKYPYQYGPANPSGLSLKTSSGIFIVSQIPLKVLETIQYNTCNGADCFAKKGAMLVEGVFNGNTFQLLGTHLNAGGPQWLREEQFKMMNTLLNDFQKLNVPQIVAGDMNTHKEDEVHYQTMLDMLAVEDISTQSKQVNTTAKDRSVIDYVFYRKNRTSFHPVNKEILWINPNKIKVIDKLNNNLSDHLAVSVSFAW